jgi:hypothetical protein
LRIDCGVNLVPSRPVAIDSWASSYAQLTSMALFVQDFARE